MDEIYRLLLFTVMAEDFEYSDNIIGIRFLDRRKDKNCGGKTDQFNVHIWLKNKLIKGDADSDK